MGLAFVDSLARVGGMGPVPVAGLGGACLGIFLRGSVGILEGPLTVGRLPSKRPPPIVWGHGLAGDVGVGVRTQWDLSSYA